MSVCTRGDHAAWNNNPNANKRVAAATMTWHAALGGGFGLRPLGRLGLFGNGNLRGRSVSVPIEAYETYETYETYAVGSVHICGNVDCGTDLAESRRRCGPWGQVLLGPIDVSHGQARVFPQLEPSARAHEGHQLLGGVCGATRQNPIPSLRAGTHTQIRARANTRLLLCPPHEPALGTRAAAAAFRHTILA
jgi:hypothetical protein